MEIHQPESLIKSFFVIVIYIDLTIGESCVIVALWLRCRTIFAAIIIIIPAVEVVAPVIAIPSVIAISSVFTITAVTVIFPIAASAAVAVPTATAAIIITASVIASAIVTAACISVIYFSILYRHSLAALVKTLGTYHNMAFLIFANRPACYTLDRLHSCVDYAALIRAHRLKRYIFIELCRFISRL